MPESTTVTTTGTTAGRLAGRTAGTITANGAELYYERRGSGRALLLIPGASGDAEMFARAADALATQFTVVTYDRRGNSRSPAPAGWVATTVDEQADDAAALIEGLGLAPALVFGNSSGATITINLALRHPRVVRAAIAHEPPKIGVLPNRDELLDVLRERADAAIAVGGYPNAMLDFHGWLTGPDEGETDVAQRDRVLANGETWITKELGVIDRYDPPAELIASLSVPLTLGVGTAGGTALHTDLLAGYNETLRRLAASLGAGFREFSGAHVPYETHVTQFAAELTEALTDALADPEHTGR